MQYGSFHFWKQIFQRAFENGRIGFGSMICCNGITNDLLYAATKS